MTVPIPLPGQVGQAIEALGLALDDYVFAYDSDAFTPRLGLSNERCGHFVPVGEDRHLVTAISDALEHSRTCPEARRAH